MSFAGAALLTKHNDTELWLCAYIQIVCILFVKFKTPSAGYTCYKYIQSFFFKVMLCKHVLILSKQNLDFHDREGHLRFH